MDARAGLKDYFARLTPEQRAAHGGLNPTPDTLQKRWVGARTAKKEAYAEDEPARNARAAEEQARAEARAKARAEARAAEEQARAEARAAQEKARAEALALAARAADAPLTEEETAALIAKGGRAVDSARRALVVRTTDMALEAKGPAGKKKVKKNESRTESMALLTARKRKQRSKVSCRTRPGSWSGPPVCWWISSAVGPRC